MGKSHLTNPKVLAFLPPQSLGLADRAAEVLFVPPADITWIPAGTSTISAGGGLDGEGFMGDVLCDERAAQLIAASYAEQLSNGQRVWLDFNHDDAEASGWVLGFSWDPARGIVAAVEWTAKGADALEGKSFYSFSPAFLIDRETNRPCSLIAGHAAGGLVNAPAFGPRMPALIAARLGATPLSASREAVTASGGTPDSTKLPTMSTATAAPAAVTAAAEEPSMKSIMDSISALAASVKALQGEPDGDEKKKTEEAKAGFKAKPVAPEMPAVAPVVAKASGVQVVSASLQEVLKGYAAEKDSLKRGVIFAREFSPRYKKDFSGHDVMQVLAANSLGSLAGDLIAQQALALLKYEFPILGRVATDFSNLNAQYGQTIKTRTRTIPTVGTYSEQDGYVATSAGTTDATVTLNNHKFVEIPFSANELASTARNLFEEQVEAMHYALGKDMVDALYALMLVGNFSNTTTQASAAALARADIQLAKAALNKRGVPQKIRTLLVNSDALATLFSDAGILNLAAYQKPSIIEQGVIANVAGFDIVEAPNLITTANQTAFGFSPDALVLATRVPNDYTQALPGAAYGNVGVVTNPDTGISVQSVQYVNHQQGKTNWRIALMYGVAVGQAASGQRIRSAA